MYIIDLLGFFRLLCIIPFWQFINREKTINLCVLYFFEDIKIIFRWSTLDFCFTSFAYHYNRHLFDSLHRFL